MATVKPRTVTPIIHKLRQLLNGRVLKEQHRHEQLQSPRTEQLPKLPFGTSHKLENNYYLGRDGRRESIPPVVTYETTKGAIESGTESEKTKSPAMKTPVPGLNPINWDM